MLPLPDIQRTADKRDVMIDRVGVTGIRFPVRLRRGSMMLPEDSELGPPWPEGLEVIETVADFEMSVGLEPTVKGTHMSRFTEALNRHVDQVGTFSGHDLQVLAQELGDKLQSRRVYVRMVADYFIQQAAPSTKRVGTAPLKGILEVNIVDGEVHTRTGIEVHGKTCCPCSREISDFDHATQRGKGAHAQRSTVQIMVSHPRRQLIWFEHLVHVAWNAFSSPVFPVLKRPDERLVTMAAYGNPKFVEDVIRDIAVQLRVMPGVLNFKVRVQNAESIHYHDAFAEVTEVVVDEASR